VAAQDWSPRSRRDADPDSDVVDLVANNDMTAALRLLMQRHGSAVYRYCREALRDAALADDVQQHVFIQAFRDLPKFRRQSTVRTWLFSIARHRALDAAKARRRSLARLESEVPSGVPAPGPLPGEAIDDRRLEEALVACLAQLPVPVRHAVLLRFQQGFTFEDMAVVCGEKPGTLQAKVARALPQLRACIEHRTGASL